MSSSDLSVYPRWMPKIPTEATNGQKYTFAMEITEQAEADSYFKDLVDHQIRAQRQILGNSLTQEEAEAIERSNLGYYAGYFSPEHRARVEKLFRCAHPIFGAIATNGSPSAEQAFKMGMERGKQARAEEVKKQLPTIWDRLQENS